MATMASLNTKIDLQQKNEFIRNTAALGMTPSAAIKVFVRMFNLHKGFPFDVRIAPRINYEDTTLERARLEDGRLVVPSSWRDDE